MRRTTCSVLGLCTLIGVTSYAPIVVEGGQRLFSRTTTVVRENGSVVRVYSDSCGVSQTYSDSCSSEAFRTRTKRVRSRRAARFSSSCDALQYSVLL